MNKFLLRRIGLGSDQAGTRPSLNECINVVLLQADALMDGIVDGLVALSSKTLGKSFTLAAPAVTPEAAAHLRARAVAFRETFATELRLVVFNSGSLDVVEPPLVRFDDLELFDSKQIDASIEFAMARQEVFRCVEDVLPALNARVSHLLGWITVQPPLNPLKPDAFVRALQASLIQQVPNENMRAALLMPAAGLLGVGLRELYREVSDWLRSQGVESASPLGHSSGVGGGVNRGQGADNAAGRTLVTLDKLRKLLSGELESHHAGIPDFSHTVPASFVALEDMKLVEPMMKRLAQRASESPPAKAGAVLSTQRVAREPTQGKILGRQLGAEVVRMMLDNLMLDKRLLLDVREVIKRLESTLLALAQADPRFFSDRQHPARQFLDRLTHRSLGYASENDEGFARFLNSISNAVGTISHVAPDAESFAQGLYELEEGWILEDATQRRQQGELARALRHAEQRNLLAQRLADDFQSRQKGADIPELVSSFLQGPWAQVVAESQLACVDGSADPGGYLALVDDLLWSVQVRRAKRNRQRLVQLVPTLLVALRRGLQLIHYPEERLPIFFDALISLHEKAFEGPRQSPARAVLEPIGVDAEDPVASNAPLDASDFWVAADDDALESDYLASETGLTADSEIQPWSVVNIDTGMWVELMVEDLWRRAQLTWASPHRTLFMFVSRGGEAHSMSRRTMERLRMQGRIRLVSDGHMVEHALDGVAVAALRNDLGQFNTSS